MTWENLLCGNVPFKDRKKAQNETNQDVNWLCLELGSIAFGNLLTCHFLYSCVIISAINYGFNDR